MTAALRPRVFVGPTDDPEVSAAVVAAGAELSSDAADADCLIWLSPSIPDLKERLHPGIRWVQVKSAGVDHLLRAGIVDDTRSWTSARGAYAEEVAEHGLALMLAASRRLHEIIPERQWGEPGTRFGRVFAGSQATIVGAGSIGEALIRLMTPFRIRVTAITRSGRQVAGADASLAVDATDESLSEADFVVLAAPSTPSTVGSMNRSKFERMKDSAWLINIGRGDLVVTEELVDALSDRVIGGAALDVTEPEPLPDGHPLWGLENVIITPHTSNPPLANSRTLAERVVANLERLQSGQELLGVIDPDRGY